MQTETEVAATNEIPEEELIVGWRFQQLQRAGFDTELAFKLAVCSGVDLHDATELVERGCEPMLAAQILL